MFTKEVHNSLFLTGNNSHKYWTRSVVRLWERFNEAEPQLEIRKNLKNRFRLYYQFWLRFSLTRTIFNFFPAFREF